jgi:2-polyprenyl-3-methyl-5-hydroxy-6-metoxy-1,4-benzoquinol methylase
VSLSSNSLERLVPDHLSADDVTGRETLELHLERYRFAARHARPGRLLDIACGVGYGTRLLRDESQQVDFALGVDLCQEAVAYARERYGRDGVEYRVGDAMQFEDPEGFDTIVSLETLEHLPHPAGLIDNLVSLLRPEGVLVASVPTTPSVDVNPHHLHDFTEKSFRHLFAEKAVTECAHLRQVQPFGITAMLRRSEVRLAELRPNLPRYYARHPGAALRRLTSTVRFGFANCYITIAWQRCT